MTKNLVNPIALATSRVSYKSGDETRTAPILDLSFVRVVISDEPALSLFGTEPPTGSFTLDFELDRYRFSAQVTVQGRGDEWVRLSFDKIVPSARSLLRSFLSPKKVGESIVEDWRSGNVRHYHGLNESELWFDPEGSLLFTYLDQTESDCQFIIRMTEKKGPIHVGKILRSKYMEMKSLDGELDLLPINDRDTYIKLSECRDVITNFRPVAQVEYGLKQRLLRAISDHLYSANYRVEVSPARVVRSTSSAGMEN